MNGVRLEEGIGGGGDILLWWSKVDRKKEWMRGPRYGSYKSSHHLVSDAMGVVTVFTNSLSWPSCNSLP